MPYVSTKLSIPLSSEKENIIKAHFGKAISAFPGKSENWLMCDFQDNCHLWFKGTNDTPSAFISVSLYGGEAPQSSYDKFTAEACSILEKELAIPSNRIYIKYDCTPHWGYNGSNF